MNEKYTNCQWSSNKCNNPNNKNKDKFIEDIKECKPLLIDETVGIQGCIYYAPTTSKFDPIFISDTGEDCKWCPKEKCDNYEDSCYGIGYGQVPLNYYPNCGKKLELIK